MKKVLALVLCLMMIVCAAALAEEGKTYKIGFSQRNASDQFPKLVQNAIEARAAEYPEVELVISDAQGDVNTQVGQIESLVAAGCDLIIMIPQDTYGLNSVVEETTERGIPVVIVNGNVSTEAYTSRVASNDYDAGCMQGEFLMQQFGTETAVNYVEIYGVMGSDTQWLRKSGVEDTWCSKNPNAVLLADQTANWTREEGMALAEDWIQRFPELNLIISQNDDMALGALAAVQAAGLQDQIMVVGGDAIEDALLSIKNGGLACTVFQTAEGQGAGAVDQAMKILRGEDFERDFMIPFELVTAENVDNYLK